MDALLAASRIRLVAAAIPPNLQASVTLDIISTINRLRRNAMCNLRYLSVVVDLLVTGIAFHRPGHRESFELAKNRLSTRVISYNDSADGTLLSQRATDSLTRMTDSSLHFQQQRLLVVIATRLGWVTEGVYRPGCPIRRCKPLSIK